MKAGNEVWDDWANNIGQKRNDEKSQQNDENDVRTFSHFFWFMVAKCNRFFSGINVHMEKSYIRFLK